MNNDANDSKRGTDDVSDDDVADKLTPLCSPITSAGYIVHRYTPHRNISNTHSISQQLICMHWRDWSS